MPVVNLCLSHSPTYTGEWEMAKFILFCLFVIMLILKTVIGPALLHGLLKIWSTSWIFRIFLINLSVFCTRSVLHRDFLCKSQKHQQKRSLSHSCTRDKESWGLKIFLLHSVQVYMKNSMHSFIFLVPIHHTSLATFLDYQKLLPNNFLSSLNCTEPI